MLGWYNDRTLTINPFLAPRLVRLAAFVDYDSTVKETVVVNVFDKYYLQYNRYVPTT
jgi:hypothetical protein